MMQLLRYVIQLILVIDGALPEFVCTRGFFHYMAELRVSEALDLRMIIEGNHQEGRDKKINESLPDAAKELAATISADFPAPVNLNPFIDFARGDVHA
jgi:hypothetical protein